MASQPIAFTRQPHPAPTPADVRAEVLANPGFGTNFTDHMVAIDWRENIGWHNARIGPRGPIALDPAAAVLHYAQEIFEGLKAYQQPDGGLALFRPEANAARFNASAERLAMPALPEETFVESIRLLVDADRDWVPAMDGASLYLRVPLKVDVIRDRAAISREVEGGLIENVYRLQVMNTTEQARAFDLVVSGVPGVHVWGEAIIGVGAATSRSVPVKIRVPEGTPPGSYPIELQVRAIGVAGVEVHENSVFIVR